VDREQVASVFEILVEECGASPKQFDEFSAYMLEPDPYKLGKEFRFMGNLGYGGKFYASRYDWRVDCYGDELTPDRQLMITRANERLEKIQPYTKPPKERFHSPPAASGDGLPETR